MTLREKLKLLHDYHDQIVESFKKATPEQIEELKKGAAKAGNPVFDLLRSLLSDPTKIQTIIAFVMLFKQELIPAK